VDNTSKRLYLVLFGSFFVLCLNVAAVVLLSPDDPLVSAGYRMVTAEQTGCLARMARAPAPIR